VGTQVAVGRAVTGLKRYPEDPRKNKRGFRRGSQVRTGSSGLRRGGRRQQEVQGRGAQRC
jgi:hypothetical protein